MSTTSTIATNALSSISGISWNDLNGNKIFEATESGLSGQKIELIDSNSNVVKTAFTDDNGYYKFTDLDSGSNDNCGSDVFRFYNAATDTHFYTGDATEKANILAHPEWQYSLEGACFEGG